MKLSIGDDNDSFKLHSINILNLFKTKVKK